jgi:hypothetical protein
MDIVFNILVIGFIGLIAYWWANQGLFSATLHFVCVFCAGVLAFASWEPIVGLLLTQRWMEPYALGVGLLLPFAVYLFALRLIADKLAPDNLNFPQLINLSVGGGVGALAGILTVGIALIGVGHIHSSSELLGVTGAARTNRAKGQPDLAVSTLWLPVHSWTAEAYSWLSEKSMGPTLGRGDTLASLHPNLGEQAMALQRDTYEKSGRIARTVAGNNSLRIDKVLFVPEYQLPRGGPFRAYVVDFHFDSGATTEGQGFAVSASQLRLIGAAEGANTRVAYPIGWSQPNAGGGRSFYMFDDAKNYISAPPGTTTLDVTLVFDTNGWQQHPRFLHAMGRRLALPAFDQSGSTMQDAVTMQLGSAAGGVSIPASVAVMSPDDLTVNDSIMPANVNLNNLGAMDVKDDRFLFKGLGDYTVGGFAGNKSVMVKGVWAPPNTRVVRLNISRKKSSVDVWNDRNKDREEAGDDAKLMLVDDLGRVYNAIGYIHVENASERRVSIRLDRDGNYHKINSFPNLASAGGDDLFALFTPAVGRKIVGVKLGDKWIAKASLDVIPAN